jgi:hypothetical protein
MTKKLNKHEAAAFLNLSAGTLEVCTGRGPRYAKLGKRVVYDITDLEAFVSARKIITIDSMQMHQAHCQG